MGKALPVHCAICGKPALIQFNPFCSSRCASVDLGRWLGEAYRVPAGPANFEEGLSDRHTGEEGE